MTTPLKYEDLALKVAELERREAALREELERSTARYDREVLGLNNEGDPIGGDPAGGYKNDNARLQQRLTVAEQRVQRMVDCSKGKDSVATGYLSDILALFKPAAEGEGS